MCETMNMSARPEYDAEREARPRETGRIPGRGSLLTPGEVAERLRVTSEQVRCLIRKGQLEAVNVGTGPKRPLYRITPEAVDEFLARRQYASPVAVSRVTRRASPAPDFFPNLK